jgi:hypothetical protein
VEIPLEKITAKLLREIEESTNPPTPECLNPNKLAAYIDFTLPTEEWDDVEFHLRSCLHCLNELVELRTLNFLETNSPESRTSSTRVQNPAARLLQKFGSLQSIKETLFPRPTPAHPEYPAYKEVLQSAFAPVGASFLRRASLETTEPGILALMSRADLPKPSDSQVLEKLERLITIVHKGFASLIWVVIGIGVLVIGIELLILFRK